MTAVTSSVLFKAAQRGGGFLAGLVLLASVSGCQALKVQQVWEDEGYHGGRPQKVLVMCNMSVPTVRRAFENEFVKELKALGITGVESFRVVPEVSLSDDTAREAMVALIKEQGFDAVLITRAMRGRTEVRDIPGMTIVAGFGSPYYGGGVGVAATIGGPSQPTTHGYSHEQEYLTIESLLFDVRTEKRIWASQAELRVAGLPQEQITPYVGRITGLLAKAAVFK